MKINYLFASFAVCALLGCNDTEKNLAKGSGRTIENSEQSAPNADNPHDLAALAQELGSDDTPNAQPIITADGLLQIDWSLIDTKAKPVNPTDFNYPFAADSVPVQNYAKAFDLSASQAQHSMMLSMASGEALSKILDQLGGEYREHEFRDGADPALIIRVSDKVISETHDYVLADKFAEGLVLPVHLVHQKNK